MAPIELGPVKWIEYGVYGDFIIKYSKPYSIYLRVTIGPFVHNGSWPLLPFPPP